MEEQTRQSRYWLGFVVTALVITGGFFAVPKARATYGDTTTFAGKIYDGDGGPATSALLDFPDDVAVDAAGNRIIADTLNHAIRVVNASGIITTLAGGGLGYADGTGAAARLNLPKGVAVGSDGTVYVADTGNDAIRAVTPAGVVTTIVNTGLSSPTDVSIAGTTIFLADTGNDALKSVSTSGGSVTTHTSSLSNPRKIAATADGSAVYIADTDSHRVLKVAIATGVVTVVAGSGANAYAEGTGSGASFQSVYGIALSPDEGTLYVADIDLYLTDRIRTIALASGTTALFAIDEHQQEMIFPSGMAVSGSTLSVAMSGLGIIRRYNTANAADTAIVAGTDRFGNRAGTDPLFGRPHDLALTNDRAMLYIAENNHLSKLSMATKSSTYVTGSIVDNYRDGLPIGPGVTTAQEARFSGLTGITVSADGKTLYVTDRWNNRIRKIDLNGSTPTVSLVSGAGRTNSTGESTNGYQEGVQCSQVVDRNDPLTLQAGCAYFLGPTSLVLDPSEQYLYVSDTGNNRIRKVRISDGQTTLIAGSSAGYADGTGSAAKFNTPWGITMNDVGTVLYVADRGNHRIRAISLSTNAVTTVAGAGSPGYREGIGSLAYFSLPLSLKMGADGMLYVGETGGHRVRQVDPVTGLTKLVSGSGTKGYLDGAKASAQYNGVEGLAVDSNGGALYVADSQNDVLRRVNIQGAAPYTNPAPTVTRADPRTLARSWAVDGKINVKLFGTGFRFGAVTTFYTKPAVKTYVISSTQLVVTLPVSSMPAGWYDITVRNTDGQTGFLELGIGLGDTSTAVPQTYFTRADASGFLAFSSKVTLGLTVAAGNVWGDGREEIIVGTAPGLPPHVKIFSQNGKLRAQFFAYGKKSTTGVRVASCDVDGDGQAEVITAPGPGARGVIRVLTSSGKPKITNGFAPLGTFKGGVNIACGDVNGDGKGDIIIAPSKGRVSDISVRSGSGAVLATFRVYAKSFLGGVLVGTADIDGNGTEEIVTAPEAGSGRTLLFSGSGKKLTPGFYGYGRTFRGGVAPAGGDPNSDGRGEMVIGPASAALARIKVLTAGGKTLKQFLAYPRTFTGGVRVAVGDVNGDGVDDIVTVPASGFPPSVRMFKVNGTPL